MILTIHLLNFSADGAQVNTKVWPMMDRHTPKTNPMVTRARFIRTVSIGEPAIS
jgi:hypothetical protein